MGHLKDLFSMYIENFAQNTTFSFHKLRLLKPLYD